jgi:ankyrin repeat protein
MNSSRRALAVVLALGFVVVPSALAEYSVDDLVDAAKRGDYHAVHFLIEGGADLEATGPMGSTALRWAAMRGHWRILAELLAAGAEANVISWDGGSPLHAACHHDNPEAVGLLVEAGADISLQNQWGRAPLHVAARRGCLEVAALLLETGADPDVATKEGWTPLHVAALSGDAAMMELLLSNGADPLLQDDAGRTAAQIWQPRQRTIEMIETELAEYTGIYDLGGGFSFKVWLSDDSLRIREFAPDDLLPVGMDSFQCRQEPWKVRFVRGADGVIEAMEVDFLRRTVRGQRTDAPRYVGSQVCIECHAGPEEGNLQVVWMRSPHGSAYWRLGSDWAIYLGRMRPHYHDLTDPISDERCLLCHVTGAQDDQALFAASFRPEEGIGCESCHGPGSKYVSVEVMSDRKAFLAAGGRIPDEATCRSCHRRSENFDWAEKWPKIAHPRPRTVQLEGAD